MASILVFAKRLAVSCQQLDAVSDLHLRVLSGAARLQAGHFKRLCHFGDRGLTQGQTREELRAGGIGQSRKVRHLDLSLLT